MSYQIARRFERVPLSLEVVWEGLGGRHKARTVDVSLGGCFVDTIGHVAVGENVNFRAHLPTGEWTDWQGEVVYEMWPTGFGMKFTALSEGGRKALAELIDTHRKQTADWQEMVAA